MDDDMTPDQIMAAITRILAEDTPKPGSVQKPALYLVPESNHDALEVHMFGQGDVPPLTEQDIHQLIYSGEPLIRGEVKFENLCLEVEIASYAAHEELREYMESRGRAGVYEGSQEDLNRAMFYIDQHFTFQGEPEPAPANRVEAVDGNVITVRFGA